MVWCGVVWCGVVWCGVVWCVEAAAEVGSDDFAFVWYDNPKPTVSGDPRVHHVQVFWCHT